MLCAVVALHLQNAAEKPPFFLPSWTAMYAFNIFVVVWVFVVGFGFGGWASVTNFVRQVDSFGLFAKCYQCKPPPPPAGAAAAGAHHWNPQINIKIESKIRSTLPTYFAQYLVSYNGEDSNGSLTCDVCWILPLFFFWLKLLVWSNSVLNCDDSFAIKA